MEHDLEARDESRTGCSDDCLCNFRCAHAGEKMGGDGLWENWVRLGSIGLVLNNCSLFIVRC